MKKKMMRIAAFAAVCMFLFSGLAIGERTPWDCPECGRKGNTGNFCGGCAHPAPEAEEQKTDEVHLPEEISFTTHLDVNSGYEYVRGVYEGPFADFPGKDLSEGEYYSPALVIWNSGDQPIGVSVSCVTGDYVSAWKEYPVEPGGNLVYRLFDGEKTGSVGTHTITWYCNGMEAAKFTWIVR